MRGPFVRRDILFAVVDVTLASLDIGFLRGQRLFAVVDLPNPCEQVAFASLKRNVGLEHRPVPLAQGRMLGRGAYFFIDKPARAWQSEQQFFGGLFSGLPIWNALIPADAVLFLAGLVAWNADAFRTLLPTTGVIPLFIVVAWLPNWLVLTNPMVMIDNFVWIVVFLVLSLVIAAAAAVRCTRFLQHRASP
jgi:hypothetical protein